MYYVTFEYNIRDPLFSRICDVAKLSK